MIPQAENNNKKEKQDAIVLRALESQKESCKPVQIARITGIPQASARRVIRALVQIGKVQKTPENKYSII